MTALRLGLSGLVLAWLAGCASQGAAPPTDRSSAAAAGPPPLTDGRLAKAATAPLSDLNLVKADIPPVLRLAMQAPYGPPQTPGCTALAAEVRALDAALGADLDTPATAANPSLIERGSDAAGEAVVGAVRNTAEGIVPFRGWVRKLTGAERYAKEVAAAIAAGTVRRAYLKGLGQASGCTGAAVPAARLP